MTAPNIPRRPLHREILVLALLAAFGWFPSPTAHPNQDSEGSLEAVMGDRRLPMPLQRTEVQVEITGFAARVQVLQVFANPFEIPIEAIYRFPLSDRGAVDDMVIQIGSRRIQGRIKKRDEARAEYDKAVSEGRRAALLDQERPNVFTQNVANILPGEEIAVQLRYVEPLGYAQGTYTFIFPMVVAPRFTPPDTVQNTGGTPSSPSIFSNPDFLAPDERSGANIALTVTLDAGVPLAGLTSSTHVIDIEPEGDSRAIVRLAPQDRIPNKDFVLQFKVGGEVPETALLTHRSREEQDGYFLLILQPKISPKPENTVPKEIIFVMDVSGSMQGIPLDLCKKLVSQAIEDLGPRDTFNIVVYSDNNRTLWENSLETTFENRQTGRRFVEGLNNEGGTMLLPGLKRALDIPRDPARIRILLLLTDGLVSNEEEVFQIRDLLQGARLFTFGIGSAPNRYLVSRLAQVGRGEVRFFAPAGNAADQMKEFFDRINQPVLTDLSIDWGRLKVEDLHPDPLPDLYAGEALRLLGRYLWEAQDTVILRGRLGNDLWEQHLEVSLPAEEEDHEALAHVWARQHIDDLMLQRALATQDSMKVTLQEEITRLALEHGMMTPYTSFVAVEEDVIANPDLSFQSVDQPAVSPANMLTESVCVRAASRVVTLDKSTTATIAFSEEYFPDLPVLGREYRSVLALAPGVQDSDGDGNPNVHGSREQDFKMTVDSISNVDPLTGEFMSNINPDAIEEIEVQDGGADASYGGAVGAFGKITTKSGSNESEGSLSVQLRADAPADSNVHSDGSSGPRGSRFDAYFSGPVVKDHLWFTLSHSFATDRDRWITGQKEGFLQTRKFNSALDKLVWQAGPRQRWILSFQSEPWKLYPAGVDSVTSRSTGFTRRVTNPNLGLSGTFIKSPTFFMEFTAHQAHLTSETSPFASRANNECYSGSSSIEGNPLSRVYCEDFSSSRRSGPFFRLDREERSQRNLAVRGEQFLGDWLGGSHRIVGGLEVYRTDPEYRYRETPQLIREDLLAGRLENPSSHNYLLGTSFPDHNSMSGSVTRMTVFLTDSFEPFPNLRFNAGLRLTRQALKGPGFTPFQPRHQAHQYGSILDQCLEEGGSPRECSLAHLNIFTASTFDDPRNYENCEESPHPQSCQLLASLSGGGTFRIPQSFRLAHQELEPRMTVSWDPRNDGKNKFYLSWGRYGADLDPRLVFTEGTPDRSFAPFVLADSGLLERSESPGSAFRTRLIDRSIRSPHSEEMTAGFAREIAPETALEIKVIARRIVDQWQQTDLNHRKLLWDELTAADHERYPDCRRLDRWADCTGTLTSAGQERPDGLPDRIVLNPFFNEVILVGNQRHSRSRIFMITIDRRFFKNWEASFSYTWSGSRSNAAEFGNGSSDRITIPDAVGGPLSEDPPHLFLASGNWFIPHWGGYHFRVLGVFQQGLPYSLLQNRVVIDFPSLITLPLGNPAQETRVQYAGLRTTYPSGKANDRRNSTFWHLDLALRKELPLTNGKALLDLEILNLFDRRSFLLQRVERRGAGSLAGKTPVGTEATGRQYRLTAKIGF